MSPIKTVLFDLDDTLFDHRHSNRQAINALKAHFDCFVTPSLDDLEKASWEHFEVRWYDLVKGEITVDQWMSDGFQRMFTQYEFPFDDAACSSATQHYTQAYLAARQPIVGAAKLLEHLRDKVSIGIVTNHLAQEQHEKLRSCKLDTLVDFVVCADEAGGIPKPEPKMFEMALAHAGCTAQEAVMVGDSWSADVGGANALGMRAVWFNPYNLPCPDPSMATVLMSLEPVEEVAAVLLG